MLGSSFSFFLVEEDAWFWIQHNYHFPSLSTTGKCLEIFHLNFGDETTDAERLNDL